MLDYKGHCRLDKSKPACNTHLSSPLNTHLSSPLGASAAAFSSHSFMTTRQHAMPYRRSGMEAWSMLQSAHLLTAQHTSLTDIDNCNTLAPTPYASALNINGLCRNTLLVTAPLKSTHFKNCGQMHAAARTTYASVSSLAMAWARSLGIAVVRT